MSIITEGIELAKNVFAVHGVDDSGKAMLVKPKVVREQLLSLIAQLPPCLIGMEACSGAHHLARLFRQHGHIVRLMATKFISTLADITYIPTDEGCQKRSFNLVPRNLWHPKITVETVKPKIAPRIQLNECSRMQPAYPLLLPFW